MGITEKEMEARFWHLGQARIRAAAAERVNRVLNSVVDLTHRLFDCMLLIQYSIFIHLCDVVRQLSR